MSSNMAHFSLRYSVKTLENSGNQNMEKTLVLKKKQYFRYNYTLNDKKANKYNQKHNITPYNEVLPTIQIFIGDTEKKSWQKMMKFISLIYRFFFSYH
jgi:hypothetical protein